MPTTLSLEDLGLLQVLEKISENAGEAIDRFARYGLFQSGFITDGEPPLLTELGASRLVELRRAREGKATDLDPSPA